MTSTVDAPLRLDKMIRSRGRRKQAPWALTPAAPRAGTAVTGTVAARKHARACWKPPTICLWRSDTRLTIEGIAERAGVAKQTIYRWWSSKNDILMDAFVQDAAEALIPSDTADLRQDLRTHARKIAHFLTT